MAKIFLWLNIFVFSIASAAQEKLVVSGPMLGSVELKDAKVWLEVTKDVKTVSLQYKRKGNSKTKNILYKEELGNDFNPLQITIGGLD